MKQLRMYVDTSVFGGCFDEEFAEESNALFDAVKGGKFLVVISPTTLCELDKAPEEVQQVLAGLCRNRSKLWSIPI